MNRCEPISESLTAWIDGELSPAEEHQVAEHVAACPSCSVEAERLRRAVTWQTKSLPAQLVEAPVDVAALRMGLRRQLNAAPRDEEQAQSRGWAWLIRPVAMATAGLAAALLVVVWRTGAPAPLLVSLGVEAPPAELATHPDMFKYFEVIENLEALEHFEAVEAVHLEDERAYLDDVRHG